MVVAARHAKPLNSFELPPNTMSHNACAAVADTAIPQAPG